MSTENVLSMTLNCSPKTNQTKLMITTIIAAAATSALIVCACFLAYGKGHADGENDAYRDMEASVQDIAALATMGAVANMPSNADTAPKSEN